MAHKRHRAHCPPLVGCKFLYSSTTARYACTCGTGTLVEQSFVALFLASLSWHCNSDLSLRSFIHQSEFAYLAACRAWPLSVTRISYTHPLERRAEPALAHLGTLVACWGFIMCPRFPVALYIYRFSVELPPVKMSKCGRNVGVVAWSDGVVASLDFTRRAHGWSGRKPHIPE